MSSNVCSRRENLQPIKVLSIPIPPPGVRRVVPQTVVEMFLQEVGDSQSGIWTVESALVELTKQINSGGLIIAWKISEPPVPLGFALCEPLSSGKALFLSHLWVEVQGIQRSLVVESLVKKATQVAMVRTGQEYLPVDARVYSHYPRSSFFKSSRSMSQVDL